jgi:hypothetical protein
MLGNFADLAFETASSGDNFLHRRGADARLRFSKDLIMIYRATAALFERD